MQKTNFIIIIDGVISVVTMSQFLYLRIVENLLSQDFCYVPVGNSACTLYTTAGALWSAVRVTEFYQAPS